MRPPALPLLLAVLVLAAACAPGAAPFVVADAEARRPVLLRQSQRTFDRPHDLALTPTGLYLLVADLGNGVIKVLDPGRLKTLGSFGRGELSSPHDVAFDAQGRVLVADTGNDRIAVYRFDGVFRSGKVNARLLESWSDGIAAPEGVAAGAGGRVFVANTGNASIIALEGGRVVARVGAAGAGPGRFARPHDVQVDGAGRVLVADAGNNRIQVLTRDLGPAGTLAGAPYNFRGPKYLAVDAAGMVLIADEDNNQIKILDAAHRPAGVIGSGRRGDGAGELDRPEGVDATGRYIWVSDTGNGRILLFRR